MFVFRDGGTYCGEWTTEGAHGCGVCTGPNNSNVFEGRWEKGAQVSGVFSWPSGQRYAGTWAHNTRHGLGKEIRPDGSEYCGDFRNNLRGTYGVLKLPNGALYRGTWEAGLQDGVGLETYADKGECMHDMCAGINLSVGLFNVEAKNAMNVTSWLGYSLTPFVMNIHSYGKLC